MLPYTYINSTDIFKIIFFTRLLSLLFLLLLLVEESGEGVLLAAGAGHISVLPCGSAVLVPWALLTSAALPSSRSVCVSQHSAEGVCGRG